MPDRDLPLTPNGAPALWGRSKMLDTYSAQRRPNLGDGGLDAVCWIGTVTLSPEKIRSGSRLPGGAGGVNGLPFIRAQSYCGLSGISTGKVVPFSSAMRSI